MSAKKVYNKNYNSDLIWGTVSRLLDEVIPPDHPRRFTPQVIQWYDFIHSKWYSTPD